MSMKKITIEQFKELINQSGWEREFKLHAPVSEPDNDGFDVGFIELSHTKDGMLIEYFEGFKFKRDDPESFEWTKNLEENLEQWETNGFTVVDEDHDEVSTLDLCENLVKMPRHFSDHGFDGHHFDFNTPLPEPITDLYSLLNFMRYYFNIDKEIRYFHESFLAKNYQLEMAAGEVDFSSLPTFGGDAPADTMGVWSWDHDNLLMGQGLEDLTIVNRKYFN